jgi:hypothetical protein
MFQFSFLLVSVGIFVVTLAALCLFGLTVFGVIRQKAPAAIFIVVLMTLWVIKLFLYGVYPLNNFLQIIPILLFFISMLIIVLSIEKQYTAGHGGNESELLKVRSIGLSIFLSLITFGIYGMVWNYSICKKIRLLNHESTECTGEWLCLEFVPYYGLYWVYTRSKKISSGAAARGISMPDNGTICLVVSIFGLGIIAFALIQNSLNGIVKNGSVGKRKENVSGLEIVSQSK